MAPGRLVYSFPAVAAPQAGSFARLCFQAVAAVQHPGRVAAVPSNCEERGAGQPPRPTGWQVGTYYSKKLKRQTDHLGNMVSSPDTIAAPPGWTPDAQLRLAAEALAPQLQRDPAALLGQVRRLQALLPGAESAVRRIKPADLVRMAANMEQVAQQLVALRERFPAADVAAMVASHPALLGMAPAQLDAAVAEVQRAFPEASQADLEAMVSTNAGLLDGGASLQRCLTGMGHLMSRPQLMRCLQQDPAFLYQFQPLESLSRGERDKDYQADMFRPQ